ncbi:hypothetical protein WMY93_023957 [Mugilogobius chulae]|uniref:4Fe-4S ferredoxin-type domain-containing protein n=1 Tax=Mugilogobius chulae TaxID=88201 RepID=A0AAW0NCQ6_9GOBI
MSHDLLRLWSWENTQKANSPTQIMFAMLPLSTTVKATLWLTLKVLHWHMQVIITKESLPAIDCEGCAAVCPELAADCAPEPAERQQLCTEEGWINKAIKDALSQAEVERGLLHTGPRLLGAAMQRRRGAAGKGGGVAGQQSSVRTQAPLPWL